MEGTKTFRLSAEKSLFIISRHGMSPKRHGLTQAPAYWGKGNQGKPNKFIYRKAREILIRGQDDERKFGIQ
jgi:hypothetical protein